MMLLDRKKHAAEHEEQMRRQAEHKARKKREKAIREETRRMERAAEEERRQRRRAKERLREVEERELYETRWKALLAPSQDIIPEEDQLRFEDIPWPVIASLSPIKGDKEVVVRMEDLSAQAITDFLLESEGGRDSKGAPTKKDRKEKLRETMLRFHPDKFEGRIMRRVRVADRERVKEAVGIVARTVNTLMAEGK